MEINIIDAGTLKAKITVSQEEKSQQKGYGLPTIDHEGVEMAKQTWIEFPYQHGW